MVEETDEGHPMTPHRNRLGAAALAVAGLLYPAFRPWHDEDTVGGALASMGSNAWFASHLFAIIGLILVPFGLLAAVLWRAAGGQTRSAVTVTGNSRSAKRTIA
jgi:hypothetical protein